MINENEFIAVINRQNNHKCTLNEFIREMAEEDNEEKTNNSTLKCPENEMEQMLLINNNLKRVLSRKNINK